MRILGIDNVMIPVGDLGTAKDFYGDILGLAVKFEMPVPRA
jgi:catechol 2,3-dioxygenase-like lactoylglutathione lyase family enzyme